MVLYRKYRPQIFKDLVGQKQIKESLLAALDSGKISHGYLFAGPKGTGKTSTARIFAKAVNCQKVLSSEIIDHSKKKLRTKNAVLGTAPQQWRFGEPCNKCTSCLAVTDGSHLDLVEIDAASNRGIDEIRDLREKIKLSPVSGRFRIYIIDEAHMLTSEAFNALLKTLEEPPQHVIFILCTTNPTKMPATILSRLARFNFKRATSDEIIDVAQKVANAEKIKVDREAFSEIAKVSEGSYRDALSILDQLAVKAAKITQEDVKNLTLVPQETLLFEFVSALAAKNLKEALTMLEENVARGGDFSAFCQQVVLFLEKALLFKIGVQEAAGEQVQFISQKISFADLQTLMKLFLLAEGEIENYPLPHIPLILAACKYCATSPRANIGTGQAESTQVKADDTEEKSVSSGKHPRVESKTVLPVVTRKGKKTFKAMSQVETVWGDFLARMKPVNAHLVAILRATRPAEFDGERLTLVTFYRFHKDKLEEPKILAAIEKILSGVLGQAIHLKINLADRWDRPPKVVAESDVVEVESSDLVSIASEIFSK